jgi:hypothetical protein
MEGAAMTSLLVNPQGLLLGSAVVAANENPLFSLSHSCAQMPGSDPVARTNAPIRLVTRLRYSRTLHNRLDLFLDFKENFPHSNLQKDAHGD